MKRVCGVMLVAALAWGAEAVPKPVPVEKQEALSRLMLAVQDSQLAVARAQAVQARAEAQYAAALAAAKKDAGAEEECQLTFEKTWVCPKK